MPELPEVQTTVNGINEKLRGLKILDVWTDYKSSHAMHEHSVKNTSYFKKFKKDIIGAKIVRAERRAKNILIHLSNRKTILIHMKMTGHLMYGNYSYNAGKKSWVTTESGPLEDPFNQFIHLVFTLNKKHLVFSDVRKFAKIVLLDKDTLAHSRHIAHLGHEPLDSDFTPKILYKQLSKKPNGKIKQVLMDQEIIAGIGNIYSDEILFASGVHPLTQVKKLTDGDIKTIWKNSVKILKEGIAFKGDSLSDYRNIDGEPGGFQYRHKAYRQTGKPCPKKDGGIIERIVVGGRSSHFCPVHQKLK
jgi:formamidopyrimidine-DNA glycosylase